MEIWKSIQGLEGSYEISSEGRVKSLVRQWKPKESILKPIVSRFGYLVVRLGKGYGKHKEFKIHRLVAQAFIPNPEGREEVNHIDGNKLNNIVSNLEWSNRKLNLKHAFKTGLITNKGTSNPKCKLTEAQVLEIRKLSSEGKKNVDIAPLFNVTISYISNIINYRTWKDLIS